MMAQEEDDSQERFVASMRHYVETKRQGGHVSALSPLAVRMTGEWQRFASDRQQVEQRWLMDLRQYLGIYEPDVAANLKNRSKAFRRKTRSKIKAVDARLFDLLFPANKERNYVLQATPEPTVPDSVRQQIVDQLQGAPENKIQDAIREYVDDRATRMSSTIDDQLTEAHYRRIARSVVHSGNLYGTGVLKGPLVEKRLGKVRYVYDAQAKRFVMRRNEEFKPFIDFVPLWRWYPDMTVAELEDCRAVWERHLMSKHGLLSLAKSQSVDGETLRRHVMSLPDGQVMPQTFEQDLRMVGDTKTTDFGLTGQYELLERWGWLTREDIECCGVKLPTCDDGIYYGNLLILPDGRPVKAVLQPMEGQTWPYHIYYFDKDETSIFGEGLATLMRGDQDNLNAATRAMMDNAAITAGPQLEVFVEHLAATEKADEIFPFKIWPRTSGDPQYPILRAINIDSHINELQGLAKMFDESADEVTAIPKFFQAENPTQGAAATSSGLSMLLTQANIALKDLVVSFDEGVTKPFVTAMYAWNMQFNPDDSIKGDYDADARGAASLVAKEVRSQLLAQFTTSLTPEERAYIKWQRFAEQRAEANELGDIIKSKAEVEEDENSEAAQLQQQLVQAQQKAIVAELEAKVRKLLAEISAIDAKTINERVSAAYAATQAGGVAAANPVAAAAGDEILKSAGFVDQAPGSTITTAVEQGTEAPAAQPVPDLGSPYVGQRAGIETPETPG